MRIRLCHALLAIAASVTLAACSSSPSNPSTGSNSSATTGSSGTSSGSGATCTATAVGSAYNKIGTGTMSAQINGVSWTAVCIAVNTATQGIVSLAGIDTTTNPSAAQVLGFGSTNGVGTYQIGPTSPLTALLLAGGGGALWQAVLSNGSGTLTLTTSTSNSLAGTFSFTLVPGPGSATGNKVVTNGAVNISF